MLDSISPQYSPKLAHPLFGSIVGLLEFLLFLIEPFKVVVFCDHGLRSTIELASEIRDGFFEGFHVRNHRFFALLPFQPCHYGSSIPVFPPVILGQFSFFSYLAGVVAGVHLFPSVFVAIVVETVLPACDLVMSSSRSSPARLLWDPVLPWVRFHLLSPVVVVGDTWFSRSPGELWVPA